jgi:hypothetical protein
MQLLVLLGFQESASNIVLFKHWGMRDSRDPVILRCQSEHSTEHCKLSVNGRVLRSVSLTLLDVFPDKRCIDATSFHSKSSLAADSFVEC